MQLFCLVHCAAFSENAEAWLTWDVPVYSMDAFRTPISSANSERLVEIVEKRALNVYGSGLAYACTMDVKAAILSCIPGETRGPSLCVAHIPSLTRLDTHLAGALVEWVSTFPTRVMDNSAEHAWKWWASFIQCHLTLTPGLRRLGGCVAAPQALCASSQEFGC